ncbi:MAG TPA: hypothetical protein VI248_08115 [Kineosporiaceae bacterium]
MSRTSVTESSRQTSRVAVQKGADAFVALDHLNFLDDIHFILRDVESRLAPLGFARG